MGTRSVEEAKAPLTTRDWMRLCGQVAADLLNRRRELPEVHGFAKVAMVASEHVHAETRRAITRKALGQDIKDVEPAPTA